MPKLGSKKSRLGCTNCKRRRVKCDETKPNCSNCSKYKMNCVYAVGSSVSGHRENEHGLPPPKTHTRNTSLTFQLEDNEEPKPNSRASSHQHSNSLNVLADAVSSVEASSLPQSTSLPPVTDIDGFQPSTVPQQPLFTLLELELLHHFTTTAYNSIARDNTADVWRYHVPELAYTREWLMRGLIAITALHMVAAKAPEPEKTSDLLSLAATSLNAGLPVFNHLVATADLSDKPTCSALASYTGIVAVYALAMPSVQHHASVRLGLRPASEPLDDVLGQLHNNFELVRGTAEVYRKVWHAISTGPMAPMTQVNIFTESPDFTLDYDELLVRWKARADPGAPELQPNDQPRRELLGRVKSLKSWIKEQLADRPMIQGTLALAQDRLAHIVMRVVIPDIHISRGLVFAWPATCESLFMRLFQEQFPPALALLAVFAVILRETAWITRGWRAWITDALMDIRQTRGANGEDINNDWWGTVEWAAKLVKQNPHFLEDRADDEGFT